MRGRGGGTSYDRGLLLTCTLYCVLCPVHTAFFLDWLAGDSSLPTLTYLCSARIEWFALPLYIQFLYFFLSMIFRLDGKCNQLYLPSRRLEE